MPDQVWREDFINLIRFHRARIHLVKGCYWLMLPFATVFTPTDHVRLELSDPFIAAREWSRLGRGGTPRFSKTWQERNAVLLLMSILLLYTSDSISLVQVPEGYGQDSVAPILTDFILRFAKIR